MRQGRFSILLCIIPCLLLVGSAAPAQGTKLTFHWAPSPMIDAEGEPLSPAVRYEVYHEIDGALEILVATVADTLYTLNTRSGTTHRIRVCGVDGRNRRSVPSDWSDPVTVSRGQLLAAPPKGGGELAPNYPNPFNPETMIVYGLPEDLRAGAVVGLEIFDARGRFIRRLEPERTPGWHQTLWDGRDQTGRQREAGQYMVRLACNGSYRAWKMTMVK